MAYLSDSHRKLSKSQKSRLMTQFSRLSFDKKITTVGLFLAGTIGSAAMAWNGESSDKVYFCLKAPTQELRCQDKNNRPYRLTAWHWQRWEQEGIPAVVVSTSVVKASNPYKPLWSGLAFVGFAATGWFFRQLQDSERRLAQFEDVAERQEMVVVEIESQLEIELLANEGAIDIQKAELLGETDIKITQMEAAGMIFEAETAGMTEEQKREYVDFLRLQQTPYLQGSQTLHKTVDPRDKVEGAGVGGEAIAADNSYQWIDEAVDYCSVLVFGGQKSGKTTLASHIIKAKKERGDRIIIIDPHAAKGQWDGLEVIGAGMDYQAIDEKLAWYYSECKRRYKLLASEGEQVVKGIGRVCIVTEEFTNYARRCKNAGDYLQAVMSDNRKIYLDSLMIGHNNTLPTLGGAKGLGQLRDDALLEIKLIPPTLSTSRQAFIKLPGQDFKSVALPTWEPVSFGVQVPPIDRDTLERIWELEFNLERHPEPSEPNSEPLNQPTDKEPSENLNQFFTPLKLTREQAIQLIEQLRTELNQTELIERLWRCKKGGSAAWREAYSQFRELMGGDGGE